jgi:hypothetical protein
MKRETNESIKTGALRELTILSVMEKVDRGVCAPENERFELGP